VSAGRSLRLGACLLAWLCVPVWVSAVAPGCAPPSPGDALARVVGIPAPVVLVIVGSLRADRLLLDPARPTRTPFLAGLAAEGIVFERAYCASTDTRAAVASLLTGRAPARHGCLGPDGRLDPGLASLPQVLADMGYDTRAVVADPNLAPEFGFARGWRSYRLADTEGAAYAEARHVTGLAGEDVEARMPPPSLLLVNLLDPHWPLNEHAETEGDVPAAGSFDGSVTALAPYWRRRPGPASVERALALYDGEIAHVDRQLEALAGLLAERGHLDGAWFVVTSDHGLGLWDHDRFGPAGGLFEGQIRVPLIIRPPRGLPRALRVREPCSLVDLAPTLIALLGGRVPESMEGRSWADALLGSGPPPVRALLLSTEAGDVRLAALIDGRYKLLLDRASGATTLYDLARDPTESAPLARRPGSAEAETALRLGELLERLLPELQDVPPTGPLALPLRLRARIAGLDAGQSDG
jgi:arylsulfatase A-like enzyme